MLDINGLELQVGDKVLYTNRNLNDLRKGEVIKITRSRVVAKFRDDFIHTFGFGTNATTRTITYHDNIMNSDQVMKL